ncbi:hypothetical protein BCV70DRAFT_201032 [Testicularia cyperi]|uniref:Uncharacterized protein n=1 Tax=Testicularia cyperi TaxID=1882483 RepID=A0A317XMD2_9BASI|nr:hypothetical protein BCV70DRAFT_201032 [Testicularia cyperi]
MSQQPAQEPNFGSYDGSSSTSGGPAAAGSSTRLPGLAGTQSEKQLTPRELAALKTIKRNVDLTKYGGWAIGAAGTWVLMSRRKPLPTNLQRIGWSVVGGLGGSFLLMPIGILASRSVLRDVEDPQHLRQVLLGAMQEQREGKRPNVGVAPPKGLDGESPQHGASQPGQREDWGAAAAPAEASYSQAAPRPSNEGQTDGFSESSSDQTRDQMPDGTGAGSRWAQLRGERSVEPSRWERIRQDNARNTYNRQGAGSQQPPLQQASPPFGSESDSPGSSTLGGGYSSTTTGAAGRSRAAEPVMSLSGGETDPRWSNPASYQSDTSGWGNSEFLRDPSAQPPPDQAKSAKRGYGVFSVVEDQASSATAPLQGFQIESDAPIQVVKGSLLSALAGGVGGSIFGVMKGRQGAGTVLGFRTAFNCFAFGFPFFAIREYIVSPVLHRSSSGFDPSNQHMRLRTLPNRHTDKIAASGLAGALAGAGLATFARGPRMAVKGAATFGVVCMGVQFAGNELRIARDTLLRPSRGQNAAVSRDGNVDAGGAASLPHDVNNGSPTDLNQAQPTPSTSQSNSTSNSNKSPDTAVAISQAALPLSDADSSTPTTQPSGNPDTGTTTTSNPVAKKTETSWLSYLKHAMPVRSVSDEEYGQKLQLRLQDLHHRIADIQAEIREIEGLESQRVPTPSDGES